VNEEPAASEVHSADGTAIGYQRFAALPATSVPHR